jgi:hypothetical protein
VARTGFDRNRQGSPALHETNFRRVPSKADMEEIAWIIRTKDVNRQVGFSKTRVGEKEDELEIVPSE